MDISYVDGFIDKPSEFIKIWLIYLIVICVACMVVYKLRGSRLKIKAKDISIIMIITTAIFFMHYGITNDYKVTQTRLILDEFIVSNTNHDILIKLSDIDIINPDIVDSSILNDFDKLYNTDIFSKINNNTSGHMYKDIINIINGHIFSAKLSVKLSEQMK